jgi:DNA-binding NarL/FixJ family response regulator
MKMKRPLQDPRTPKDKKLKRIEVSFAKQEFAQRIHLPDMKQSTSSKSSTIRPIRTFHAEESPAVMALLARALRQDERVSIVGSAMFGAKTFSAASSLTPDLVVMDEHWAGVDCTEVTRRLKDLPNPPTVFIVSPGNRAESQSRSLTVDADAVLINAPKLPRQLQAAVKTFFAHGGETEPQSR